MFTRIFLIFLTYLIFNINIVRANEVEGVISKLASDIVIQGEKLDKVAVAEFSNLDGDVTALGKFLSEELITSLLMLKDSNIQVIERRHLMRVLEEQKLSTQDLLEPKAIESIGKLLGVDTILTGTTTDLGDTIRINARIISVSTGAAFASARSELPKTGTIEKLLKKVAGSKIEIIGGNSGSLDADLISPKFIAEQKTKGFSFKVQSADLKSDNTLSITMLVTALEKNTSMTAYGTNGPYSRVIYEGNEIKADTLTFGSTTHPEIKRRLVMSVPIKVKHTFLFPFKKAKKLSLYEPVFNTRDKGSFTVQFYQIPLTKK